MDSEPHIQGGWCHHGASYPLRSITSSFAVREVFTNIQVLRSIGVFWYLITLVFDLLANYYRIKLEWATTQVKV